MNSTPTNYTEWEHHVPDHTVADDGFGNLLLTNIDTFWFNVERSTENLH
jgi:hypothetical protein